MNIDELAILIKLLKAEGITHFECKEYILDLPTAQDLPKAKSVPSDLEMEHKPMSDAPWLELTDEDIEPYLRTGRA